MENNQQVQPSQPVEPASPTEPAQPSINHDQEWDSAASQFAADKGINPGEPAIKKEENNEPTKPIQDPEKTPETPPNSADSKSAEKQPEAKSGDDADKKPDDESKPVEVQDNPAVREARMIQRGAAEERTLIAEDVRKELFGDVKDELTDADGDPIRTVEDAMKLMNPNTGKPLTQDEATIYLFEAQRALEKELATVDKQVEEIAEINLSLKDQGDNIRVKYGDILEAMPDLRDQLWAEFSKTLEKDEKTGIITKAPVSLERFYELALAPHVKYLQKLEAEEKEAQEKAEKARQELQKKQVQSDRTDIVSGGKSDTMDPEEREWAEAAKEHYGTTVK